MVQLTQTIQLNLYSYRIICFGILLSVFVTAFLFALVVVFIFAIVLFVFVLESNSTITASEERVAAAFPHSHQE